MAVKRLYEREYGLEILVGDPQVQLGDDTILDILDGYLRGGGETGGIENGKLRIEIFVGEGGISPRLSTGLLYSGSGRY